MKKFVSILAILSLTLAACGGSDSGGNAQNMAISGFAFASQNLTISQGDSIIFENQDSAPHTVTADDGSFDANVGAGATSEIVFDTAGTFTYHCDIHPSMTATVTVEG